MTQRDRGSVSTNFFEAAQHATGITVSNAAPWLGPAVAALWIWTEWLPSGASAQSPLLWFDHYARAAGWTAEWAANTDAWLGERPELFWPLIITAALTASVRVLGISTVTWGALLCAISLGAPERVALCFLVLTFAACFLGYTTDKTSDLVNRGSGHTDYSDDASFNLSFATWVAGPLLTLVMAASLPLWLAAWLVEAYRNPAVRR